MVNAVDMANSPEAWPEHGLMKLDTMVNESKAARKSLFIWDK